MNYPGHVPRASILLNFRLNGFEQIMATYRPIAVPPGISYEAEVKLLTLPGLGAKEVWRCALVERTNPRGIQFGSLYDFGYSLGESSLHYVMTTEDFSRGQSRMKRDIADRCARIILEKSDSGQKARLIGEVAGHIRRGII